MYFICVIQILFSLKFVSLSLQMLYHANEEIKHGCCQIVYSCFIAEHDVGGGNLIGPAVGGCVGGALVIIAIVALLVFIRKSRLGGGSAGKRRIVSEILCNINEEFKSAFLNSVKLKKKIRLF